jgi:hypothetical protein
VYLLAGVSAPSDDGHSANFQDYSNSISIITAQKSFDVRIHFMLTKKAPVSAKVGLGGD